MVERRSTTIHGLAGSGIGRVWLMTTLMLVGALWIGAAVPRPVLAFTSDRNGGRQIYLLDMMTEQIEQATNGSHDSYQATWGQGSRLAFASYPAPTRVTMLDLTRWEHSQLSAEAMVSEYEPDWSPDGRLAVAARPDIDWDVVVYDGQKRRSAPFNTAANELEPCWWWDGTLSFVSNRGGTSDIYRYDFASDTLTNLTNEPGDDYNPSCSADGQLAFTSTRDLNADIYVMDLKTGAVRNVTQDRSNDFNPAWLPDGRLSFVSDRSGDRDIYVLNLATGALENVTHSPGEDDQPSWSK